MSLFKPNCLPLLIGSLPSDNHRESVELIFDYTPQIPLWPQLPVFKREGMILQYAPGFPGITERDGKVFVDTGKAGFEEELLALYEDYLMVSDDGAELDGTRFILSREAATGFYDFLEIAADKKDDLVALKGQTTGPVTFCTGLVDNDGRAIFYNDQLRDAAVKHLAMKARWQIRKMAELCDRTIMFFDEPALAGLGSSALITVTDDDIKQCFAEVFDAVRMEKGLTGVHVCANTEWSVIFESGVDIVSYDAYSYFDKLILYGDHLKSFFRNGGILATGIVPTSPEYIDIETAQSLTEKWRKQTQELVALGIPESTIYEQTLITPSCGTGTVTGSQALRVIELTKEVSERIRG
ncbi:MAG: hypothetical protein KAI39_02375 [Desulfobulbaceae bacterium]|nr:hypothetical protein [Desulfobulbaceae bacterium]